MLETTLKTEFTPATNLKGDMVSADWRFLLPTLELDTAACFGFPPISTIHVLSKMCREVLVFAGNSIRRDTLDNQLRANNIANVRMLATKDLKAIANNSIDLVFIVRRGAVKKLLRNNAAVAQLSRVVRTDGVVFFRLNGLWDRLLSRRARQVFLSDGFSAPQEFWIAPALGRMRMAMPLAERDLRSYFVKRILSAQGIKNRLLKSYGKILGSYPRALVSRYHGQLQSQEPPAYLVSLGKQAGLDLSGYRWGVAAGGRYNAKKIVFYLFNEAAESPEIVVKLTRSPEFNPRLENEYRALALLNENKVTETGSFPEPLFHGYHSGLVVVGQRVIDGDLFSKRTTGTSDCPYLLATIDWLTRLATNSLDAHSATTMDLTATLKILLNRFCEIYNISPDHSKFLAQQIDALSRPNSKFPLVFQHGDAGSWNVLITPDDKIAYIDWEAAEPNGLPLWDLFYFIKTYGTIVFRREGKNDSLHAFTKNFLTESDLGSRLIDATVSYCETVGVDKRWIEPLFYTCWVHRALKEATRLRHDTLGGGHYLNLLLMAIENRDTPVLQTLFSLHQN
jgi:thiamine kinase-like enzyme/SAM-dependent methyltransferase